ncbi:BLUF domain-containing protein [Roseovarius sp. D22-M7]|uniref:BLUF domain-containing protein n=1 Tax=Roseovarius sp. D22-M7 TaxID=3127116 RepID=UPI0030100086
MEYLIYKSMALVTPGSAACRDIVTVSQRNNAGLGLTGFLHAEDGLFIQYLEGPPKPLWALYERLHGDDRHRDLVLLGHGAPRRRRFGDWRLGYSEAGVLSFADFLEEVSMPGAVEPTPPADAIMFLMAASIRLDLGIAEPPQHAWR